jgi:hypothetical protein
LAGLYKIPEKIGHLYRIDLLETIKAHPVFSLDKLRKTSNDPLPGQQSDPPLPIQVNGDDRWEVDEILARKVVRGPYTTGLAGKATTLIPPGTLLETS